MIHKLKKAIKWTVTPFLDEEGFPSLTNISLVVILAVVMVHGAIDLAGVGAITAAFASHAHKRFCNHKAKMAEMSVKANVSNSIETVQTAVDQLSKRVDAVNNTAQTNVNALTNKLETLTNLSVISMRPQKKPDVNS
jgi:hypothetical protein